MNEITPAGEAKDREPVICCVCGAEPPRTPAFVVQTFSVVRCPGCGVLRVSPRLTRDALRKYYDAGYWKSPDSVLRGYFDYAGDEANIRRTFRRRLQWIRRHTGRSSGQWLDVGCAYGFLLLEAQQAGWSVGGLDWSEHAAGHAPEPVRGQIRLGSLLETEWPEQSWDMVSLWDYLEHSPDPRADLEKAVRLLKPGGWLSVIVPDPGSWLARWLGPRWEEYNKPQEHLYFFTGRQLAALGKRLGLGVRAREWAGKYARWDFAVSRFRPEDGLVFQAVRVVKFVLQRLGLLEAVVYINPRAKVHLLFQKERT